MTIIQVWKEIAGQEQRTPNIASPGCGFYYATSQADTATAPAGLAGYQVQGTSGIAERLLSGITDDVAASLKEQG